MEVVPLLHIKNGQPLVGRHGDWRPADPPYPDGGTDLADLARHLSVRFGSVCLVDLGTGRSDEPHLNLYQKLIKQNVRVWVDAFPETLEDVMDLFVAGADQVTVRLDRFDADELDEVLAMAEGEVWLGLPFRTLDELDSMVRKLPLQDHLKAGASGTVLIDLTAAGTGRGGDPGILARGPREGPVYLAGGIQRPADADPLAAAGVDGIFVGSGLFQDLASWAEKARETGDQKEPREVGTSSTSVRVDEKRGWLPGILPDRPGTPHAVRKPEDEEQR